MHGALIHGNPQIRFYLWCLSRAVNQPFAGLNDGTIFPENDGRFAIIVLLTVNHQSLVGETVPPFKSRDGFIKAPLQPCHMDGGPYYVMLFI